MLIGQYQHNIDAKNRVIVPAKFREDLGERFYVTKGLDGCLFVLSEEGWKRLQDKIVAMPMSKARQLQRFFFSGAAEVEPDKQGRILIPQPLRDYASIEKDVTFIGTGDRAEIWSTECWTQFNDNLTEDSIAEAMDALSFYRGGQFMAFVHKSVLFNETIDALNIRPDGIYVDGTAGGGGHSGAILERLTTGTLISIDQDPDAIAFVSDKFRGNSCSIVRQGQFSQMTEIVNSCGFAAVDGVLMDIGVSSYQLDTPERGFSYHHDAPLDMRMSQQGTSAKDLVNTLPWQKLAEIISRYGEDKYAKSIAKGIVKAREEAPIETTLQLAEIVKVSVPASVRREQGHPARKTFQALRIEVNGELEQLSKALDAAFELLKPNGRLAIITFHSLEDRMVKQRMNVWCQGCTCPPDFPICVCGNIPKAKLIYKKGLSPSEKELEENPRSRSARLRVCEKL